jgi:hypothetical protein
MNWSDRAELLARVGPAEYNRRIKMAYVLVTSACFGCGKIFSYHPNKVPSIPIEGERRPICQACVALVNPKRIKNGLPPIVILPGAYEPADEDEVRWG